MVIYPHSVTGINDLCVFDPNSREDTDELLSINSTIMATPEEWGEPLKFVHRETMDYIRKQRERGGNTYPNLGAKLAREASRETSRLYAGNPEFKGTIAEYAVPTSDNKDGIPVSVYKTSNCPSTAPILVYFHGGGFVVGCRQNTDSLCRVIARDTPCIIVNSSYRLAPEFKYPTAFDDAECVVKWTLKNKTLLGGCESSKVGVSGDSAGGNIAASVCHNIDLDFQVLIYPMTDNRCAQPSFREFATTPLLNESLIKWFQEEFLSSPDQITDTRCSPLLHNEEKFCRLPPALFIIAALDPLRDCGYAYRDKMKTAGVHTECLTLDGIPHAYFHLPGHFVESCAKSYAAVCEFIKKF